MSQLQKVLFLCTGNSARSQMAEGMARNLSKGSLEVYSAGLNPKGVHPIAIAVMEEIGINIRHHTSKGIDLNLLKKMDFIITVCGNADERCPTTPAQIQKEHWPIPDPVSVTVEEPERYEVFRKTRDEIKSRIQLFLKTLSLS